jgi:hypothetical protein
MLTKSIMKWLILLLMIPGGAQAAKPSVSAADLATVREHLCENLLQTEKADVQLPLQPELLEKILLHFYDLKLFDQKPLEADPVEFQTAEGPMREYLREILNSLEGHRRLSVKALVAYFLQQRERGESAPVELTGKKAFRPQDINEIQSFFHNEITKLPLPFQEILRRQNRRFYLTADAETFAVKIQRSRSAVFARQWREPWEKEQTAVVGERGDSNPMLMEVLKNLDEACRDESGQSLSATEEFRTLWRDTELWPEERHLRFFPQAAFAAWGSWYYDSPQSRQRLSDLYPRVAGYFAGLMECPQPPTADL